MAVLTHVYRRGPVYWWRRRIPIALVDFFPARELRISLRTHLRRDAAHRAARLRLAMDVAFDELERCAVLGMRPTPQGMKAIVDELVRGELEFAERARALTPPRTPEDVAAAVAEEERRKAAVERSLALCQYDAALAPLAAIIRRGGMTLNFTEYQQLTTPIGAGTPRRITPGLPQPLIAAYECARPRPKHPSRGAGSCMA